MSSVEAEADITEAAVWYEAREHGLGLAVTAEIHSANARALQDPLQYLRLRERPHVRRILVRRFPFAFFTSYGLMPSSFSQFFMPHNTSAIGNAVSKKESPMNPQITQILGYE